MHRKQLDVNEMNELHLVKNTEITQYKYTSAKARHYCKQAPAHVIIMSRAVRLGEIILHCSRTIARIKRRSKLIAFLIGC